MNSSEIRQAFFDFFREKDHFIVDSAPMVIKNDPTLMFTNAGMNQFKDIFLGNRKPESKRVANSQKCLRVSGKHNDLEEVGKDTYHHTMFEMLGNWSFGDYFKKEAIDHAWEFLTKVMKIDPSNLYATVFEGNKEDNTDLDEEAMNIWKEYLPENQILTGSKKDNFWEMGDTGPCGPCSEIHVDIRPEEKKKDKSGRELVNADHPEVIEIWNLVFIQFNRDAGGKLHPLPQKHVDTGMGFERLCMVVQGKRSNYDTDIFQGLISKITELTGISYGKDPSNDIAMRVISDHIRAISFAITDGQLPSNNKAGYVIRRILRRAVRYAFTFLGQNEPFLYQLVDPLTDFMGTAYPELSAQQELIKRVIREEEQSFLRTLDKGISLLETLTEENRKTDSTLVSGKTAFELYDTYGFPIDLTRLILQEKNMEVNMEEYNREMTLQKGRSREDASKETGDWTILEETEGTEFTGYEQLRSRVKITRFRKISQKGKDLYQLVFNQTPFYAESGGQVGDTGYIEGVGKKYSIIQTEKENELIVHITKELPKDLTIEFTAVVNSGMRINTVNNHTSTHLLHHALREVLGDHVEQKGSLVHPDYLRFDFSHFSKITQEELLEIEKIVNSRIRQNIPREEHREMPIAEAMGMGAMALFGEKYGDRVRVIRFGESVELCGGTHAEATGQIGLFLILKESAVAAGIRRIEAVSGEKALEFVQERNQEYETIRSLFPASKDLPGSVKQLREELEGTGKELEQLMAEKKAIISKQISQKTEDINGINFVGEKIEVNSASLLRDISFQVKNNLTNLVLVLGADIKGKANISIMISENLVKTKQLDASKIIREVSGEIQGGGGGQPFFATAGGKNPGGIDASINKVREILKLI